MLTRVPADASCAKARCVFSPSLRFAKRARSARSAAPARRLTLSGRHPAAAGRETRPWRPPRTSEHA
eukprot:2256492-Alexandrium_andersonii.AAC.1